MTFPESTYEILLWKHIGNPVDERWVNWAYEMLLAGYETENIIELAGEIRPFNQFELSELTNQVFEEMGFNKYTSNAIIINYIRTVLNKTVNGKYNINQTLRKLTDLYYYSDFENQLEDFRMLSYAKSDLTYDTYQSYWEGANRENIDEICLNYFKKWLRENEYIHPKMEAYKSLIIEVLFERISIRKFE